MPRPIVRPSEMTEEVAREFLRLLPVVLLKRNLPRDVRADAMSRATMRAVRAPAYDPAKSSFYNWVKRFADRGVADSLASKPWKALGFDECPRELKITAVKRYRRIHI